MMEPIELQVFPSSYHCISWSEDGELALASGEYVYILAPKPPSKTSANGTPQPLSSKDWHRTRFKANVFTINEWPIMFPQTRNHFSVGAEQSMSHVVEVAWSPPGLTKYRRSVLAVLTTNMLLSIYALSSTSGKWTRIAVVNKVLEEYFRESIESDTLGERNSNLFRRDLEDKSARLRKTNVRSFTWTPTFKVPAEDRKYPGPESRWGIPLLAVTNEDNEMVFLKIQTAKTERQTTGEALSIEAVATIPLPPVTGYDQVIRPGSLFASAVRSKVRTLSLASGPWLFDEEEQGEEDDSTFAELNVAAIQGTKLRIVKLGVALEPRTGESEQSPYKLSFHAVENTTLDTTRIDDHALTGPIRWADEMASGSVSMAIGAVAGLVVLNIPEYTYRGHDVRDTNASAQFYPIKADSTNGISSTKAAHMERISGMSIGTDPVSKTPIVYFASAGGYAATKALNDTVGPSPAPWNAQVEDLRDRFDIDRDLGGLAVSRVWGVTSVQGLIAAVVTQHPGDIIEYRTNAEDRLAIIFSTVNEQEGDLKQVSFLRETPTGSAELQNERRDVVLQYILGDHAGTKDTLSPKVLYAAACCAIVQSQDAKLINKAKDVLEVLAGGNRMDLTEEIAKCSAPGSSIEAKSAGALDGNGGEIFERCEVCDTGISWYSAHEAQCVTGHVFVRCNLTFLAIQEPGISKFCSRCENEYLDEDMVGQAGQTDIQQTCKDLTEVFDTCVYCDGKFRS
ncbi:transcription factor IIIC subunit delta N-term-domain-containing protein [Aspergillus venezuelensis]